MCYTQNTPTEFSNTSADDEGLPLHIQMSFLPDLIYKFETWGTGYISEMAEGAPIKGYHNVFRRHGRKRAMDNFNSDVPIAAKRARFEAEGVCVGNGAADLNKVFCWAVARGRVDIAQWCFDNGEVNVNEAMRSAAAEGRNDMIDFCARLGATDLNLAMEGAAQGNQVHTIEKLALMGAKNYNRAFTCAAEFGREEAARCLLSLGASNYDGVKHLPPHLF